MEIFLHILLISISSISYCQKTISADINFSFLIPFGGSQIKNYNSKINHTSVSYFSRLRFDHPYFNLTPNVFYAITPRIKIGLQSGIYVHYLENYVLKRRNTVSIPLQVTGRYSIWKSEKKSFGVNFAAGIIFFNLNEYYKYKNSFSFNGSLFYSMYKGSIFKIGIKRQDDRVSQNLTNPYFPSEVFKHTIKRLSISFSYGTSIGQFILKPKIKTTTR
jgi:hypothetical protein